MDFSSFNGLEKAYVICAIIGGAILLLQLVLSFFAGADLDVDFDGDIDIDLDHGSDASFHWLSIQSVSAFFAMFGMVFGARRFHEDTHTLTPFSSASAPR